MELFEQDTYQCEVTSVIDTSMMTSLFILYHPLIGSDAVALYGTLISEAQNQKQPDKHERLCKLMHKSIEEIEKARIRLEQFNLLKTFYHKGDDNYIYQIILPLTSNDFLKHYVYGVQYKKLMGIADYEITKDKIVIDQFNRNGYQDISIKYDQNEMRLISSKDVEEFINIKASDIKNDKNLGFPKDFDYQRFVKELTELTFPRKLRTNDNMRLIAQLATVYGININRMRVLACRSINMKDKTFDTNGLINRARKEQPEYDRLQVSGYELPPLLFLQDKQKGLQVSLSSKKILEYLVNDTPLTTPVINFLVEYVLENTNNILNQKYVEKMAETFVRSNISDIDQAREFIKRLSKTTKDQAIRNQKLKESTKVINKTQTSAEDLDKLRKQFKEKVERLK